MLKLTQQEHREIDKQLSQAETITSAPIHLHFCHSCRKDPIKTAQKFFHHAGLHLNKDKNSVLILIGKAHGAFAIIGDTHAHEKLPDDFWNSGQKQLSHDFKAGRYCEGIHSLIKTIAHALAPFFPPHADIEPE